MTLKNNRASLLYHVKLCASFQSHRWIQISVTVRKRPTWVKIGDVFVPCDLEIWRITLKNNRAPLLCCFKLCASFYSQHCIQTGVTTRKRQIGVKIDIYFSWVLTSVNLTFDLWPWPFAWTSRLPVVITPENFRMIRWQEYSQQGVTDARTDGQTDRQTDRQTDGNKYS